MIGIYKITNLVNNKIYIGQSINIEKRIKEHFWKAECEKDISYNSALHQAIRKYGKDNFVWEVLKECPIDEIDDLERYYIELYNSITPNGYNILTGGQKYRAIPSYCKICGIPLKTKEANYCIECGHKIQQICERPDRETLKTMIRNESFTNIAKKFNVSDNAIRKWCKSMNLPHLSREIKKISDEQWELI